MRMTLRDAPVDSVFLNRLVVSMVDDEHWKLAEEFRYYSRGLNQIIVVPAGFVTDFASVPRVPLAYLLAGGKADRPAVVHDFLYQSKGFPKDQADEVFLEAMQADGQPWWRRKMMWFAVHTFGSSAYETDQSREAT